MRMGIGMLMNGVKIGAVEFTFFFTSFSAGTGGAHVKKIFGKMIRNKGLTRLIKIFLFWGGGGGFSVFGSFQFFLVA
jgi:hypothetical protein